MNEPKPVYCIKSRGGRIEREGDFDTIQAWLNENRITSDDDLRRLGFHVMERDELWGRVKDFPEFNRSEREGRRALTRAKNWNYLCMVAGLIFVGVGFALICYDQLIPRYTESNRVDEAKAETRSSKELERVAYEKLKQARDEAAAALKEKDAAHLRSVALLKKQLDESREELNLALDQKQGELKDARGKLDDLSGRVSSDLASANRRVTQLTRQLEQLTRQLEEERKEAAVAQKPLKDKLAELQSRNDSLYSLYIRTNEQLKAEQGKSIAQKVFGLSSDKGE
jgi:biopolymer transport protein ExbB/TolQ